MLVDLLRRLHPLGGLPTWARYLGSIAVVVLFFGLRLAFGGSLTGYPYLLFFPAILLNAFLFDRGSGLFSVALAALLALLFVPPIGRFWVSGPTEFVVWLLFIGIGVLVAGTVEALRSAVDDLARATDDLRRSDAQRALLLNDINHRIKNHLASVAGLLTVSARKVRDVESARVEFADAASRIAVLGRVYDRLHLAGDHTAIGARGFVEGLCRDLKLSLATGRPIGLTVAADDVELSANRAVTLGLIINELVQNALKYAFPGDREGSVGVSFHRLEDRCRLAVEDDGIGMAADPSGSGQKLIRAFARQLGGTATWSGPPGTRVEVTLPVEDPGVATL